MSVVIHPQVLRVRDFRTFTTEQTLTFHDRGPLLGVVCGINEVEPDLGANGTGKSTVWDALSWCLFGKTVRGVRGSAVVPWEQEMSSTRVEFTFRRNGERLTVARTMSPNTLKLYRDLPGTNASTNGHVGENVGQETVNELVGLTWPMFVSTVVRGQFDSSFLDETPKGKLAFLSQALDLSVWEDAADMATAEKKTLTAQRDVQARDLSRAEGALEAAQAALEGLSVSTADEAARDAARVSAKLAEADRLGEQWQRLRDEFLDAQAMAEDCALSFGEREDARLALADERAEADREHTVRAEQLRAASHAVSMLEGAEATCGTCGSELDERASERLRAQLQEAELVAATTGHRLARAELRLERADEDLRTSREYLEQADNDVRRLKVELSKTSQAEERARAEAVPAPPSALADQCAAAEARVKDAAADVQRLSDAHAATCQELTRAEFWAKGFGDVRLWLLRGALDELEALVNSHTLALGLRGWRVAFDVERGTKSGGIAKGFTALITSPTTSEPVPYESWSGGELQRLKVAVQAALIDLIRSRTGGGWRFEVWDEPTQHLSQTGISDLIGFLRERSRTQDLEVWVVDHRTLTDGSFQSQITVVKKDNGSRLSRKAR